MGGSTRNTGEDAKRCGVDLDERDKAAVERGNSRWSVAMSQSWVSKLLLCRIAELEAATVQD